MNTNKRKYPQLTLWNAANVTTYKTLSNWYMALRVPPPPAGAVATAAVTNPHDVIGTMTKLGITTADIQQHIETNTNVPKRQKQTTPKTPTTRPVYSKNNFVSKKCKPVAYGMFTIGFKRLPEDTYTAIKDILVATFITKDWCDWLVCSKGFRPSAAVLNMIVGRKNLSTSDEEDGHFRQLLQGLNNYSYIDGKYIYTKNQTKPYHKRQSYGVARDLCPPFARCLYTNDDMYKGLTSVRARAIKEYVASRDIADNYRTAKDKEQLRKPLTFNHGTAVSASNNNNNNNHSSFIRQYPGVFSLDKNGTTVDVDGNNSKFIFLPNYFKRRSLSPGLILSKRFQKLYKRDRIPPLTSDPRICLRGDRKVLLQIPCDVKYLRSASSRTNPDAVCAIDPGVRTMYTMYDCSRQIIGEFGVGAKIDRLCKEFSSLSKRRRELDTIKDVSMRSYLANKTISRGVKLCHQLKDIRIRTANFLVCNYTSVILGDINLRPMLNSATSSLPLCVRTKLRALSLGRMRTTLQHRAKCTPCAVYMQNEAWTSKTCGMCNNINPNLGTKKVYTCPKCAYTVDRDINGGRNIMRKFCELM